MDNKNKTANNNIQKLDFDTIEREQIPFVTLSTYVIQNITNHFAGFIWAFLQSLPPNWEINKIHIMKHFGISDRTYQRHMSFLSNSNLIRYERQRYQNGTLGPVALKVLNGTKFNRDAGPDHTAKIGIVDFNHTAKTPQCGEATPVANGRHTNTTTTTKTKKENKEDIPPLSPQRGWCVRFEEFWKIYPCKKARKKCEQIWKRRKLAEIADEIISGVVILKENDDQWLRGFIPNPTTFLNQDRWNDEPSESQAKMREKELAEKKLANEKRIAEQQELSRKNAEYERNKHTQANKDGKAFRDIQHKVIKPPPEIFKQLAQSLGAKHETK